MARGGTQTYVFKMRTLLFTLNYLVNIVFNNVDVLYSKLEQVVFQLLKCLPMLRIKVLKSGFIKNKIDVILNIVFMILETFSQIININYID